jgi:hypothetical protein
MEPSRNISFGFVQSLEVLERQLCHWTDPVNANIPSDATTAIDESGGRYYRRIDGRRIKAKGTTWLLE